jgi:hypothetical protein
MWMWTGPDIQFVSGDGLPSTTLERGGVRQGHIEPRGVVEAVDPSLRIGLGTFDGPDVVAFSEICPSMSAECMFRSNLHTVP